MSNTMSSTKKKKKPESPRVPRQVCVMMRQSGRPESPSNLNKNPSWVHPWPRHPTAHPVKPAGNLTRALAPPPPSTTFIVIAVA